MSDQKLNKLTISADKGLVEQLMHLNEKIVHIKVNKDGDITFSVHEDQEHEVYNHDEVNPSGYVYQTYSTASIHRNEQ